MVHLSELKGPLPDAAEAKEEESSESTLTEANNGIDKPATNPAQVSNHVWEGTNPSLVMTKNLDAERLINWTSFSLPREKKK